MPSEERVTLEMTDQEAHDLHHALATVVVLLDQVGSIPKDAALYGARPRLLTMAKRLDHERRHHGAVPNPNGVSDHAK